MKRRRKSTLDRRAGTLALALGLFFAGCSPERDLSPVPSTFNGRSFEPAKPQAGQPFTVTDLALEMQPIPAGTFRMGSPYHEPGRGANEGPQTVVTISRPFWLGRTPVTHGQWKALMGSDLTGQAQKASASDNDFIQLLARCDDATAMYFVNWHEAMAFCARLNARARAEGSLPAGYEFTLPTEAQWEYACRAGTTGAHYGETGFTLSGPALDAIAWYAGNSGVAYDGPPWGAIVAVGKPAANARSGPRQVGGKQPNAWGLYDMLGNVRQWCRDFPADQLPGGSVTDPTGPATGSDRVVRGGSWHSDPENCRAATRAWSSPDCRLQFIGFRVALAPIPRR